MLTGFTTPPCPSFLYYFEAWVRLVRKSSLQPPTLQFSHRGSRAVFWLRLEQTEDEKWILCMYPIKPLKKPQSEILDQSNLFSSSNWFFECEHSFIDGHNQARSTKRTVIRPGCQSVSQQRAAHAQDLTRFMRRLSRVRLKQGAQLSPLWTNLELLRLRDILLLGSYRIVCFSTSLFDSSLRVMYF